MTTAIVGVGNIGSTLARHLVAGDLHQYGFNGELVDIDRAESATAGSAA
jgi:predicted dinucleotide-binding enzyme